MLTKRDEAVQMEQGQEKVLLLLGSCFAQENV